MGDSDGDNPPPQNDDGCLSAGSEQPAAWRERHRSNLALVLWTVVSVQERYQWLYKDWRGDLELPRPTLALRLALMPVRRRKARCMHALIRLVMSMRGKR